MVLSEELRARAGADAVSRQHVLREAGRRRAAQLEEAEAAAIEAARLVLPEAASLEAERAPRERR
jgi:hypothetical protein